MELHTIFPVELLNLFLDKTLDVADYYQTIRIMIAIIDDYRPMVQSKLNEPFWMMKKCEGLLDEEIAPMTYLLFYLPPKRLSNNLLCLHVCSGETLAVNHLVNLGFMLSENKWIKFVSKSPEIIESIIISDAIVNYSEVLNCCIRKKYYSCIKLILSRSQVYEVYVAKQGDDFLELISSMWATTRVLPSAAWATTSDTLAHTG